MEDQDPRMVAAIDMLRRTGANEVQIRYSDDEHPVVWIAVAQWRGHWEAGAGMHPSHALFALCAEVIDGGTCKHCKRPTGFDSSFGQMPLDKVVCWYQYDPELKTFRRGCV